MKIFFAVVCIFTIWAMPLYSQGTYGPIVFQDDFSTSNSVWQFKLVDTDNDQMAIDASYGKIVDGALTLKANMGCGANFLGSVASLQMPLPSNYLIQFRARKMQFCGAFHTQISFTNSLDDRTIIPPAIWFTFEGNWFSGLNVSSGTNTITTNPISHDQTNEQWYDLKIVKRDSDVQVLINNSPRYTYTGSLPSGGFLHFVTGQAGSTAEIDNLKIFSLAPRLLIETAAVRLRWFAESNVSYQVQWSTEFQTWSNLTSVLGQGALTNVVDWTDGPRRFYRLLQ